ncbi:MAG: hypothetical protein ACK5G0_02865 [Bacteroidota bacterium]|jgi:hypothetical protein
MHPTIKVLICTNDPETELSLRSFSDNHPDVSAIQMAATWTESLSEADHFDVVYLDARLIPSPEALDLLPDGVSVILLAKNANECRRYRGTRVRSCLLTPVSLEPFQWTIRSVQPMYAAEMA